VDFGGEGERVEGGGGAGGGCERAKGGVVVSGDERAGGVEEFRHVLDLIEAVTPAVGPTLKRQWSGGDGLGGIPGEDVNDVGGVEQVERGQLQVVAIEVALVPGCRAGLNHLHLGSASLMIVNHRDDRCLVGEEHGAVFGVVFHLPTPGGRVQQGLVAVEVEDGKILTRRRGDAENVGVLVQAVGLVDVGIRVHSRPFAVTNCIEGIAIGVRAHRGGGEFGAGVVAEGVGDRRRDACTTVIDPRGAAGDSIVDVVEAGDEVGASTVFDGGDEIAVGLKTSHGLEYAIAPAGNQVAIGQIRILSHRERREHKG